MNSGVNETIKRKKLKSCLKSLINCKDNKRKTLRMSWKEKE